MNPNAVGKQQQEVAPTFSKSTQITQEGYVVRFVNTKSVETDTDQGIDVFQEGLLHAARIIQAKVGYRTVGLNEVYDISVQSPEAYQWFGTPTEDGIKARLGIDQGHRLVLSELKVTFPLEPDAKEKALVSVRYMDDLVPMFTTIRVLQRTISSVEEAQKIATNIHGSPLPAQIIEQVRNGRAVPYWYVELDSKSQDGSTAEKGLLEKAVNRLLRFIDKTSDSI